MLRVVVAVVIGIGILWAGLWILRAVAASRSREEPGDRPAEDVADLDVYFVCGECGTEFKVERLGELQVPRHCGERMRVERRPAALG